jgi:hypothetical protein
MSINFNKGGGNTLYKEIDFTVNKYASRRELRDIVINKFMEEEPGLGSGDDTSKYRYNVEILSDGRRIYLTRPAYLKKGFDFRINVEGTIFQTKQEYPKHDDIFDDLRLKNKEDPTLSKKLHLVINKVYNCTDPVEVLRECENLKFTTGHSVELILKVIKWFLIEQDIRDWNYSGRRMFKNGVDEIMGTVE